MKLPPHAIIGVAIVISTVAAFFTAVIAIIIKVNNL